jgi:hypothetical protein
MYVIAWLCSSSEFGRRFDRSSLGDQELATKLVVPNRNVCFREEGTIYSTDKERLDSSRKQQWYILCMYVCMRWVQHEWTDIALPH